MIGRPSTAHVTTEPTPTISTNEEKIVTISQADYDRLLQLKVTDSTTTASHSSSTGTSIAKNPFWIIDSDASSHMSGTKDLFTHLSQLSDIRSVAIADG